MGSVVSVVVDVVMLVVVEFIVCTAVGGRGVGAWGCCWVAWQGCHFVFAAYLCDRLKFVFQLFENVLEKN